MPALKRCPEAIAAANKALLAPICRMSFMRQQRHCKRLNPRAAHLAGQGEPIVPPRIADGKTAVISRHDPGIEKVGVEATAHGRWPKVGTDIDAPREHSGPLQARPQTSGHVGIADDAAIAVDDAGKAASARPDRRQNGAYAGLSVRRRHGELDRKVEAAKRLGFGRPVNCDGVETGRPPGIQAIAQVGGGFSAGRAAKGGGGGRGASCTRLWGCWGEKTRCNGCWPRARASRPLKAWVASAAGWGSPTSHTVAYPIRPAVPPPNWGQRRSRRWPVF